VSPAYLILATFLACAVEAVEALTIVLAVGTTRGWRSTLYGVGAAAAILLGLVAILGPALRAIPIESLRIAVGTLLLLFGLQWLRKAVLRAGGLKARRDEAVEFAREAEEARRAGQPAAGPMDWYSFTLSFKGVLLEGLEVVFIVLTFGAGQQRIGLAAIAAGAAVLAVAAVGFAVRGPIARAPENALKFVVGIMLTSFGIFWSAEGVGVDWPGGDSALLAIIAFVAAGAGASVYALRRRPARARRRTAVAETEA
jgi:uncharacterized membrane protein